MAYSLRSTVTLILAILIAVVTAAVHSFPLVDLKNGALPPSTSAGRMTNAKRFAAGLPPLPPKRKRPRANLQPRASLTNLATGHLVVSAPGGGHPFNEGDQGAYTLQNNGLLHGMLVNSQGTYLGGATYANQDILGPNSPNFLYVWPVLTASTTQEPGPYFIPGTVSETSVWEYDAETGELHLVWTNPDGSTVTGDIYQWTDEQQESTAIFTPDIDAMMATNPGTYMLLSYRLQ